jgi:hypothetical protein
MTKYVVAEYLAWPLFGLVGATVGAILVIAPKWVRPLFNQLSAGGRRPWPHRIVGIGALCIGAVMFFGSLSGPSLCERLRVLSNVVEASPEDVVSARFEPIVYGSGPHQITCLFSARSPEQVDQLCDALHKAECCSGTGGRKLWHCRMVFEREEETIYCEVSRSEGVGVFLTVNARGYPIAAFRCDALGPLIESWAKEAELPKPREPAKTE